VKVRQIAFRVDQIARQIAFRVDQIARQIVFRVDQTDANPRRLRR